jgi:hypothetical protein
MWMSIGFTLAGFVAGEAWFGTRQRRERFLHDGSVRLSFGFAVTIARRDRPILEALATFLGTARSATSHPAGLTTSR